ncbi:MAG: cation transporter [Halomonas sp.]|nr:cation transporter [Halomonas sp.]MDN6298083.1 cation transporter [Halomonas sp.]MDN6315394.1 cation transporter [Halomonas sp.]MDN6336692.1 cation transporter [Halomonas sp.]
MSAVTIERRALRFSAISAAAFAFSGLALGVASGSMTILFDSGYSLMSLALVVLSLWAHRCVQRPACGRYPFGRLTVEPLTVLLKGVMIGLVCLASLGAALWSLAHGGRTVSLDLALAFGVLNVVGCALSWGYLQRCAVRVNAPLLAAEVRQWQMDTWLSAAVLVGFAVTFVLGLTPWAAWARFADPVMVLLIVGYFLRIPWRMTRDALREVMLATPGDALRQALITQDTLAVAPENIRLAQVGSFMLLDIKLARDELKDADSIVATLEQRCRQLELRPVTSITLT